MKQSAWHASRLQRGRLPTGDLERSSRMTIYINRTRNYLKDFNFKNLFIEELGWDRCNNKIDIVGDGSSFNLSAVAEKHGMVVFACNPLPDGSLPDYSLRRQIERQGGESSHEHKIHH